MRSVKPTKQEAFIGTTKKPIHLEICNYSNILHIPHYFKQSLQLSERIIEDEVLKKLILGCDLTQEEICCQPHIVSSVGGDYQNLNVTSLIDIFP